MKRIVIIGATGTGKTTLAFKMAGQLNYPAIDLDDLHWNPGWIENDLDTFRRKVHQSLIGDKWILAGNYFSVSDLVWPKADTLIWLDYSFLRTFNQLSQRSLTRIIRKTPACNGNVENFQRLISKDSIILWLFKSFADKRRSYDDIFSNPERYSNIDRYVRLKNPGQTMQFLSTL